MDKLFELNKKLYSAHTGIGFGVIASSKQTAVPVGGWVELGRVSGSGASSNLTVSSLADKRYYMILNYTQPSTGNIAPRLQLGNTTIDTGNTHSNRAERNGNEGTGINQNFNFIDPELDNNTTPRFDVGYIANLSGKEKLNINWCIDQKTAGAANIPTRAENVGKWVNTSNPLDIVNILNGQGTNFNSTSQLVVLGWDPADTHTTNFWEELASVTLGSDAATLSTGTFTAKKYLWVQYFAAPTTGNDSRIRVGNGTVDSGMNYAGRTSANGGADTTNVSVTQIQNVIDDTIDNNTFGNMFIINNASNEKLITLHTVQGRASGAANAPFRREAAWKWTNTANQINIITMLRSAGNYRAGAKLIVWGSD